jgi:hypothetical protein
MRAVAARSSGSPGKRRRFLPCEEQHSEEIPAGNGQPEEGPGYLVAGNEALVQKEVLHLIDAEAGVETGRMAFVGAAPPFLLDAGMVAGQDQSQKAEGERRQVGVALIDAEHARLNPAPILGGQRDPQRA